MTDSELLAQMRAQQWRTPLRKVWCWLAHRRYWRYTYDWATGQVPIAARCERCRQGHVLGGLGGEGGDAVAIDETEEQLVLRGMAIVKGILRGEEIGWNNALEWAATWIEGSVAGDDRVQEFARNMAMSLRAARKERSG